MSTAEQEHAVVVREATIPASAEELILAAINRGASVDVMERMLAMRDRIKAERAEEAYHQALSAFQAECPPIIKRRAVADKSGGARYRYAALSDIVAQVKGLLEKHGFSHDEDAKVEKEWVTGLCTVHHRDGHSKTREFKVPIDSKAFMNAPQQYASALTFAKRYAFTNAFGIMTADEDDDAQRAAEAAARAEGAKDAAEIQRFKKGIWDKLKGKHHTAAGVQQHLWDEGLMDPDVRLDTAPIGVLRFIAEKLNRLTKP